MGLISVALSLILTLHGVFTLAWMLYAWENPEDADRHKSPKAFHAPLYSFTALIPARHEEKVIQDTINAVSRIKYPEYLKETLILCREDDTKTIVKAHQAIAWLPHANIRTVIFNDSPINKPRSLNQGLKEAKHDIIAVFDAEDEPHPDIFNVINTVFIQDKTDIVQSGVQLMNYHSHWFSPLNVAEYFFWFKSGLHFFSQIGKVTPLGGNTVFIKRKWLEKVGGWDEKCLTEDAEIGLRLTAHGAKTRVVYDETHATQEETPTCISGFIKQRTRWNQGFLQAFLKGEWIRLPKRRQKIVAAYILLSPILQTILLLYIPFGVYTAFTQKLPVIISLMSFLPLYMFILQLLVYMVGLFEFTKAYNLTYPFWMPLHILLAYYPYQLLLIVSSFRAVYRIMVNHNRWEKTLHVNGHRDQKEVIDLPFVDQLQYDLSQYY